MTKFKIINNIKTECSAQEELELENLGKISAEKKVIRLQNEENQNNKKASGKQKLKDLGLDDDEINALIGA